MPKRPTITPERRAELVRTIPAEYAEGVSIRLLAAAHGISYGTVHNILTESGTKLRGRGGPNRKKKSA